VHQQSKKDGGLWKMSIIKNKMLTAVLFILLSTCALMSGCSPAMTQTEREAAITQVEVVEGEGTGVIADVGIVSGAMFAFDSAELNDEGKATIAAYRKKLGPELTDAFLVLIVGHTDSTGDEGHNMRLSLARADSVAEHLISTGVTPKTIETLGAGPHRPIASNDTREGRMQNRRVDIYVIAEVRALDRMNFPSAALFERDIAELSEEGKALLDRNIQTGRDMFSRANAIIVVGHTDDKWDADYNMKLSETRAATVRDYLISRGVDSTRMVTVGAGETMPIADNTTRAGRAANRRVQVLVVGRAKQ
jgi:outer membrane protein OmpA-like peptidoglycan-associated protein